MRGKSRVIIAALDIECMALICGAGLGGRGFIRPTTVITWKHSSIKTFISVLVLLLFRMSNKGSTRMPICRKNRNHLYGPLCTATVCWGKRPQHLRAQRRVICNLSLTKFIMTKGHNILRANRRASCNLCLPQFTKAKGHNI